jgi:hypothetical protein
MSLQPAWRMSSVCLTANVWTSSISLVSSPSTNESIRVPGMLFFVSRLLNVCVFFLTLSFLSFLDVLCCFPDLLLRYAALPDDDTDSQANDPTTSPSDKLSLIEFQKSVRTQYHALSPSEKAHYIDLYKDRKADLQHQQCPSAKTRITNVSTTIRTIERLVSHLMIYFCQY